MPLIPVTDPHDARIESYREIRERDLVGRRGQFIAEGEVVLRHLLGTASRFEAESVLVAENRIPALSSLGLSSTLPIYVANQKLMDAVVGFPIHRGLLGVGRIGTLAAPADLIAIPAPTDRILVVVGVGNHDNMRGLFRAAAGFGARSVILDSGSCDPLYRKAIRVSVGASLIVPFARLGPGCDPLDLLVEHGYEPWALTPAGPEPLAQTQVNRPTALIVGAEGPGLPQTILDRCRRISIPMAAGFDSLNVATAAAIALHHLAGERHPCRNLDRDRTTVDGKGTVETVQPE